MNKNKNIIADLIKIAFNPPPKLKLSEFAEEFFRLSPEASAEPGKYFISRAEYQREMLDAVCDPRFQEIVFMTGSQIGKTSIQLIILLYFMKMDPSPILFINPTLDMSKSFSKDRLTPALRDSVGFQNLVAENKSKESGNTILSKQFQGGNVNLVGSNSAAGLASRPIRIVLADEIDRFAIDNGEGNPLQLGIRRTSNFWNRKIIMASTPTEEATSEINARYQASNQSQYHLNCVHCNENFVPKWDLVKWDKDATTGEHKPETALLHCPYCGSGHTDAQRNIAVRKGKWVQRFPDRNIAGFHLSALHSPWAVLEQLVVDWLRAQSDKANLKVFVNTVLGECYKDATQSLDDLNLIDRVTPISLDNIPADVSIISAGVDSQTDRFEAAVIGHGSAGKKYILDHRVIHGDPSTRPVQSDLKSYLTQQLVREDGVKLRIKAVAIDSGGHATQEIYRFTKDNLALRFYAIKGRQGNLPLWPSRASVTDKGRVFIVGVDSGKDYVYSSLKISDANSDGYFFLSDTLTPDFIQQLTSEQKVLKVRNGYSYWQWVLPSGKRNEALDVVVYGLAAFESLQLNPERMNRKIEKSKAKEVFEKEPVDENSQAIVLPETIPEDPPQIGDSLSPIKPTPKPVTRPPIKKSKFSSGRSWV